MRTAMFEIMRPFAEADMYTREPVVAWLAAAVIIRYALCKVLSWERRKEWCCSVIAKIPPVAAFSTPSTTPEIQKIRMAMQQAVYRGFIGPGAVPLGGWQEPFQAMYEVIILLE